MPADSISTERTAPSCEIRLADYTPPAFLVDTVDLRFDLDEAATKVVSRLALRRNPAAPAGAPLHLDGEALTLVAHHPRRRALVPDDYRDRRRPADHRRHAGRLHAGDRNPHRAEGQHRTERAVCLRRQLFHPVRGGGLPPHHLFPRPARRDVALHRRPSPPTRRMPGDAVERQSRPGHRSGRRPALASPGPIRIPSRATCSPWSPAISSRSRTASPPAPAGRSISASMSAAATRIAAPMRCGR